MKKFTTFLTALMLTSTVFADTITPPWAPTGMDFSLWSSYTPSGQSFGSNSQKPSGYDNSASIWSYSEISNEDAWLISPAITLEAEKSYKVTFQYMVWNDNASIVENFDIYASSVIPSDETVAEIEAETPILSMSNLTKTDPTWVESDPIVNIKGDGDTYILFHVSGRYCRRFCIAAFSIDEYEAIDFAPNPPSKLSATAAKNQILEVALSWELPTRSTAGLSFTADQTVSAVKVLRDGEEVVTLDGTATSFTDNADSGLTAGMHSYSLQACVADVWSEPCEEVVVSHVGPATTQTIPWEPTLTNMSNDDFDTFWINYAGVGHGYYAGNWTNRPVGLFLINNYGYTQNTWLISAPLALEAGKSYQLEYELKLQSGSANVSVGLVDNVEPEAFSLLLEEEATFSDNSNPSHELTFTLPESLADSAPRLSFRDISESSHTIYLAAVKITENAADSVSSLQQDATSICVYDLSGRSLGYASSASLPGFEKGVYILHIKTANGSKVVKIRK